MTPRARFLFLLIPGLVPAVLGIWSPALLRIGILWNFAVLIAAIVDLVISTSPDVLEIHREVSGVLSVGTGNPVQLHLVNRSNRPLHVELTDETPRPGRADGVPTTVITEPWRETIVRYRFEPRRRGNNRFEAVHVRFPSMLGLWSLGQRRQLVTAVRILPDIRAVTRYELMARRNRLSEIGVARFRVRGTGGEFDRLRDYRREDEVRHIDWKATARYRKLISREFDVERNQNILILLDTGRSMCNESDGVSMLDRGLNAAIMLTYIALGQSDNVGLMAFSNRIERFVRPVRGKSSIQSVIHQTFDLEPRYDATDYTLAAETLIRRQRKRSLVILITHANDEQHLETIGRALGSLSPPHLLLCVFLRDSALDEMATGIPDDDVGAFQMAAASELLLAQSRKLASLRESGALVVETLPSNLTAELVNQYLELKARHLL